MRYTLYIGLLVTFFGIVFPAEELYAKQVDPLHKKLQNAKGQQRIDVLVEIAIKKQHRNPDSAMLVAQQALHESAQLKYEIGRAESLAIIGRLHRDQGDYSIALENFQHALKVFQSASDSVRIANIFNDISIVYAYSGDYQKSLRYFKKVLRIYEPSGNDKGVSHALNNISLIYMDLGELAKAEEYLLKSLEVKERLGIPMDISSSLANLGSLKEDQGNNEEALEYYLKAQDIFYQIDHKTGIASNSVAIAGILLEQGAVGGAIEQASIGLKTAVTINSKPLMLKASNLLVQAAEQAGDYEAALEYMKIQGAIKDSLYSESKIRHLEELKSRFNDEENMRQITKLKKDKEVQSADIHQKNIIAYALVVVFFLTLVILAIVYVAYKSSKRKKELLAFKNEKIRSQREDLMRLNRDKDMLFSIISHDIKSPLNSLRGFSHLLVQHIDSLSHEEIRNMGKQVDQSLEKLNELLDNLLTWSVSQRGSDRLRAERINVNELVEKNLELYKLTAAEKKIDCILKADREFFARADYNSIYTVLRNLLSNSLKFSYPNSQVVIRLWEENKMIFIAVKDEGLGMSDDIRRRLFDIGAKKTQVGTLNEKGSGLGLALCRQLVEENGGTLTVTSKVREGSEFIFQLPAVSEDLGNEKGHQG